MHVMIDLETLGTNSDCVVIAIGAAAFDATGLKQTFMKRLSFEDQLRAGRTVEESTLAWWMKQPAEARAVFSDKNALSTPPALVEFRYWITEMGKPCIWGNGAAFDNTILRSLYHTFNVACPWYYKQDRCYRTLRALAGVERTPMRGGVAHNALDDAVAQAEELLRIANHLNITLS